MNREWIFWIALMVVIIAASLYLRTFSSQALSLSVRINSSASGAQMYPYQKLLVPIAVQNTGGSPVEGVTLEVFINGSATTSYDVTIPPGKSTIIAYNFSPTNPGTYNISVVADPGKLYDISDRQGAQSSAKVDVIDAAPAASYSLLPSGNTTSYGEVALSTPGLILSNFFSRSYGVGALSATGPNEGVVYSLLNISEQYVKNVSASYATYSNGDSAYSVWIKGYLLPSIVGFAVEGRGYAAINYTYKGNSVMFSNFGNGTTMCSWYDGGWVKTVQYTSDVSDCKGIVNGTIKTMNSSMAQLNATIYNRAFVQNSTQIGSFDYVAHNGTGFAKMLLLNGSLSLIPIVSKNIGSTQCLGAITEAQNTIFCNVYTTPSLGYEMLRTTAIIGGYNASVFSLANASPESIGIAGSEAAGLINEIGLPGNSLNFSSPNIVGCSFNDSFGCSNLNANGNAVTFNLTNKLSGTVRINAVACYASVPFEIYHLNRTIASGREENLGAVCYQNGEPVSGLVLYPKLNLYMNYTLGNSTKLIHGNATVSLLT